MSPGADGALTRPGLTRGRSARTDPGMHLLFLDKTLLRRFATHPTSGELEGVGIKRFPEQVPRERAVTRLF